MFRLYRPALISVFLCCALLPLHHATQALIPGLRREPIRVANVRELALMAVLQRPDVDEARWSPGGSILAVAGGARVWLYDARDLSAEPRTLPHIDQVLDMAFSADGMRLAVAAGGSITVWSLRDGITISNVLVNAQTLAYSPDGARVAYITTFGDVGWVDLAAGSTRILAPGDGHRVPVGLAYDRAGATLAVAQADGVVALYDGRNGAPRDPIGTPAETPGTVAGRQDARDGLVYSDNGRYLAALDRGTARRLTVWDTGRAVPLYTLQFPDETFYALAFNTRAGILAAASGAEGGQQRVRLWQTASGALLADLPHPGVRGVAFSPDGTLLATAGGDMVRLWGVSSGLPTPEQARALSRFNIVAGCDTFGVIPERAVAQQSVSLVWSWYAATPELVREHVEAAQYTVQLNGAPVTAWRFLTQTVPDAANNGDPTIYWYAPVGRLPAGDYIARYSATWSRPISDGYADFGPGTANEREDGACAFRVG